jgi:hypothetical protein
VTNGASDVGALPNGAGAGASFTAWGAVTPVTGVRLRSNGVNGEFLESLGGASAKDLMIAPAETESLRFAANGDIRQPDAGLTRTADAGYFYLASMNGMPTGTAGADAAPAIGTGITPIATDRANHRILVRFNADWYYVQMTIAP